MRPALLEAFLDAMPAVELTVYAFDVEVVEIWSKKMKDATLGSLGGAYRSYIQAYPGTTCIYV